MEDRHNLTRHGPGGKQKWSLLPISPVPRALTVHIAAQHGFLQWVHTTLLQPLLDWGRVQADEVLGLTGATCTSASLYQPTSLPDPSLWRPQTLSTICSLLPGTGEWGPIPYGTGCWGSFPRPHCGHAAAVEHPGWPW